MTATTFQLVTPFITTFFQLTLALFLYWIKDYDPLTRGYERYTKRFQFHKAEHELRAIVQVEPTEEDIERCKHSLRNAAHWIATNLTVASRMARGLSILGTSIFTPFIGSVVLHASTSSSASQNLITSQNPIFQGTFLTAFLIVFFYFSYRVYVWIKRTLTHIFLLWSKKYKLLSYLGKIVDD